MGSSIPHLRRGGNNNESHNKSLIDPLLGLERRERAIQKDLQLLLDAQSAGLLQGFGGGDNAEAASDAGSSTPTLSMSVHSSSRGGAGQGGQGSGNGGGVVPVRQPRRKPLGLRGARRGLGRDMNELIAVKSEESAILVREIMRREEVLQKVGAWEQSIESARGKLASSLEGEGEDGGEIQDLRAAESALDNEIRELEDRLAQLQARKKWLGERAREEENKREARLSSYRGALREVEREVRDFLKRPPVGVSVVMGEERGFMSLPEKRRTLGLAKEWWGRELSALLSRQGEVEEEQKALEDGAKIWAASTRVVTEFEDGLRARMSSGDAHSAASLRTQIEKMQSVIQQLSTSYETAERNGWNLLICAVGAELEAFKEGEGILRGALEMVAGQETQEHKEAEAQVQTQAEAGKDGGAGGDEHGSEPGEGEREDSFHSTDDGLHTLAELDGALKRDEEDSEDDGPDLAELLIDRGR